MVVSPVVFKMGGGIVRSEADPHKGHMPLRATTGRQAEAAIAGPPGGLWGILSGPAKCSDFSKKGDASVLLPFEDVKHGDSK
jgi:hypothetical protein